MDSPTPLIERKGPTAAAKRKFVLKKQLESPLSFILTFCLCINLTIASPQTVSPVIWFPSKQQVVRIFAETSATFTIVNPCPFLKDKYPESMTEAALDSCNSEFQQYIVDPLSRWCPAKSVHKRAVVTLGILLFAAVVVGLGATGTIMSVKNNGAITTLQEQQVSDHQFADDLKLQVGTVYVHTKNNTRVLNKAVRNMEVLQEDYDELKARIPGMVFSSASLVSQFHLGKHYIQDAERMWKDGKISPYIFPFFNVSLPCLKGLDCPLDIAEPISCSFSKNNNNLTIRMATRVVNRDLQLMEATPMDILIRKGNDTTCRGRYVGPKKVIISKPLRCLVRLDSELSKTTLPFVTGPVKCLQGYSEINDFYKPIDCQPIQNDDHLPFVQVQPINGKIHVYCAGSNYTMNNVDRACPKGAFILSAKNRFLINREEVVAPEIELKAITKFDEGLDFVVHHHVPTCPNWPDLEQPKMPPLKPIEHEKLIVIVQENPIGATACGVFIVAIIIFIICCAIRCKGGCSNRPTINNRDSPFSV